VAPKPTNHDIDRAAKLGLISLEQHIDRRCLVEWPGFPPLTKEPAAVPLDKEWRRVRREGAG
jgi:hypothetical protein